MAEPSTTTAIAVATTGVGLAAIFPGIDGNALIGAFAGATLFVMSAKELRHWVRGVYLMISLVMGYIAAPEITSLTFIEQTGVASFLGSVFCISATLPMIRQLEDGNLIQLIIEWWRK
ncbi:putative holin [Marinobacterium iners]|uniref:Phage holin n=1 Tax=Marinobacterium iners DSM 11526 TaxID=1122198 RepID=A0A1H3ZVI4_9GAMM|nr:putative holin [Marinobacterium iners]SEA27743.1 Putative phage holin [Marinobacterium iners DSM 11526]